MVFSLQLCSLGRSRVPSVEIACVVRRYASKRGYIANFSSNIGSLHTKEATMPLAYAIDPNKLIKIERKRTAT